MTSNSNSIKGEHGKGAIKSRGHIADIVTELRRQIDARLDFTIDTSDLAVVVGDDGAPRLAPRGDSGRDFLPREGFPMLDQAFVQVAGRACSGGIPMRFMRRVWDEHPQRTADFLTGMMVDEPKRRMVRVLDDRVRAYLGQTYRAIDNYDIAGQALRLAKQHDAMPIEASLTDSHLRLRFVSRRIVQELQRVRDDAPSGWFAGGLGSHLSQVAARSWGELPGDTAHPALGFRNSETGHGGCDLDGGILLGVCFNLAWVRRMVHEVHIGEKLDVRLFTADTASKHADLVYAKMRDASAAYFTADSFAEIVADVEGTQRKAVAPAYATEALIESSDALTDDDMTGLLDYFHAQPGDATVFNLGQAVSRLAQDVEPARAESLEQLAGEVCTGKHTKALVAAQAPA
jgi:hypothetical protein